jgi:hypothetical protein
MEKGVMIMRIKSLKLKDTNYGESWFTNILSRWTYDDFKNNPEWKTDWISMDCAYYDEVDNRVYLGITTFDEKGIFMAYDRNEEKFVDLGYSRISKPYDAKFHRALFKREKDGCIYGAVALLHCVDKQWEAPGSAIIKYNPKTGEIERLATPIPHVYIQCAVLDKERDLVYCQCFPPEYLIAYNLKTGEVKNLGLVGTGISGMAQGENIEFDDNGNLWGTWSLTRAWQPFAGEDANRLFRVPAGGEKIEFLNTGLTRADGKYGYEKMEALFNLGDGYMYASGANGSIHRINPETGKSVYLFTPIKDRRSRLTSMAVGPDGCAYGITGRDGKCEVLKFDFKKTKYELIGNVVDDKGEACYQVHHVTMTKDGVLYACENDNPYRSGYLWEIKL